MGVLRGGETLHIFTLEKGFVIKSFAMKFDLLIIRIGFVLLLALGGYLLNPLARSSHFADFIGDAIEQSR